jgi:hypothetical protein
VRDHDDGALEVVDGGGERAERLAVQVVGRLVQHEQVRVVPHRCRQHQLHLLAACAAGRSHLSPAAGWCLQHAGRAMLAASAASAARPSVGHSPISGHEVPQYGPRQGMACVRCAALATRAHPACSAALWLTRERPPPQRACHTRTQEQHAHSRIRYAPRMMHAVRPWPGVHAPHERGRACAAAGASRVPERPRMALWLVISASMPKSSRCCWMASLLSGR